MNDFVNDMEAIKITGLQYFPTCLYKYYVNKHQDLAVKLYVK